MEEESGLSSSLPQIELDLIWWKLQEDRFPLNKKSNFLREPYRAGMDFCLVGRSPSVEVSKQRAGHFLVRAVLGGSGTGK